MARKNDLAKLAALAGLGAYITNQYRNKVDLSEKDSNPDREARPKSTETRLKTPLESIAEADESSKANTTTTGPAAESSTGTTTTGPAAPPNLNTQPVKPPVKVEGNNLPKAIARNRSPGDEMSAYAKNLPDVRTNFGSLVNPYPADNKAAAKENARQAAIEATNRHNEDQKAIMAERRRNQKGQQDLGYGQTLKRGGAVKKMASGGMTSSASSRGDGIATKGKTRGRIC